MNTPKNTIVAAIAISGFALFTSACSYEANETTAPVLISDELVIVDEVEAGVEPAETPEELDVEVAGSTEEPSNVETAPAEQRYEIIGVPRGLNMRTGPGVGYDLIQGIEKDRVVVGTGSVRDGWAEIRFEALTGWVLSTYLQPTNAVDAPEPSAEQATAAEATRGELIVFGVPTGLNLRSGPGLENKIVGGAPLGATVFPTGAPSGEWIEVEHDGVVGWANAAHLARG